jgi:hypothetical protein
MAQLEAGPGGMPAARRDADLTVPLACIAGPDLQLVGGKAVNLGRLLRAGFDVPDGFCVTTRAFSSFMANASSEVHDRLVGVDPDDIAGIRRAGRDVRTRLAQAGLPGDVARAVTDAWTQLGTDHRYAVRSSATAEDLPFASFAGQQDTYLGVRGHDPLLAAVRDCFASLFTDRAIGYRLRHGIDDRDVALAVIVQRMVAPAVSGVVFTADPASGDRTVAAIDASYGLGEATVSGVVNPDAVRVDRRTGRVISSTVADKRIAIHARTDGGTHRVDVPDELRRRPALSDARAAALARLAGAVEARLGSPQDIEWALVDDRFVVTQSRPITTLFPLPEPRPDDDALHAYVSFGHVQVMTDPMPPLATSLWRVLVPVGRDGPDGATRYVATAGSRVYLDVSAALRHPVVGRIVPRAVRIGDQLVAAALGELARRRRFRARGRRMGLRAIAPTVAPVAAHAVRVLVSGAPEGTAHAMLNVIDRTVARVAVAVDVQADVAGRLDACDAALRRFFDVPLRWVPHIVAGGIAQVALTALVPRADHATVRAAVGRGAPGNVVTEMDLAMGDLAQLARGPELLEVLADTDRSAQGRIAAVAELDGGGAFLAAWASFLERYGARGPSEIDISRPRWADDPVPLLQMVCGVARHGDPGTQRTRHEALRAEGIVAGRQVVATARAAPLGRLRAAVVARLVRVARHLLPLREHHKYLLVRILALVRRVVCEAGVAVPCPRERSRARPASCSILRRRSCGRETSSWPRSPIPVGRRCSRRLRRS